MQFKEAGSSIAVSPRWDSDDKPKSFSATISELFGSFFFVFMFMLCTDEKTRFSKDKVINCFVIASSYVSARLIGGGELVTGTYLDKLLIF